MKLASFTKEMPKSEGIYLAERAGITRKVRVTIDNGTVWIYWQADDAEFGTIAWPGDYRWSGPIDKKEAA